MSNFILHKVNNGFGILFPNLDVYMPKNTAGPGHLLRTLQLSYSITLLDHPFIQ